VNMVEIFSTHVCKWKNETSWNNSRIGGGGEKKNDGVGIRNFVNVTMYL
jgi:hypothetical protein